MNIQGLAPVAETPQRSAQELHDAINTCSREMMPAAIELLLSGLTREQSLLMAEVCRCMQELTMNLRPASDFE